MRSLVPLRGLIFRSGLSGARLASGSATALWVDGVPHVVLSPTQLRNVQSGKLLGVSPSAPPAGPAVHEVRAVRAVLLSRQGDGQLALDLCDTWQEQAQIWDRSAELVVPLALLEGHQEGILAKLKEKYA